MFHSLILISLIIFAMWIMVKMTNGQDGYVCPICGTRTGEHGKNCPRRKKD